MLTALGFFFPALVGGKATGMGKLDPRRFFEAHGRIC